MHIVCFLSLASNPMKETQSITYSILLLIWILHGLVWIALLFNLITKLLYEMELKLSKDTSAMEVGKKERKTEDRCWKAICVVGLLPPNRRGFSQSLFKRVHPRRRRKTSRCFSIHLSCELHFHIKIYLTLIVIKKNNLKI